MENLMRSSFAVISLLLTGHFIESWEFVFGGLFILLILYVMFHKQLGREN